MSKLTEVVGSMNVEHMETVDWLEVTDPNDAEEKWVLHVPFLLSHWGCLFGRGCPGSVEVPRSGGPGVPAGSDVGCCNHGAYVEDPQDRARLDEHVALLTEEDLHKKALDYVRTKGYLNVYSETEKEFNGKTKVRNGACVFANRHQDVGEGDDPNRIGCAFIHLAARLNNLSTTKNVDHTSTMPKVCWQLPFKTRTAYDEMANVITTTLTPWDAGQWGATGKADYLEWWCVNDQTAYGEKEPLFITAKAELIALMGADTYALAAKELARRAKANYVAPMPAVGPNGRKMLPLEVAPRG